MKIELGQLMGLCTNCLRHNPGAPSNCILARDASRLASKWKYNLMVTDCELFLLPPEVEVESTDLDMDVEE